MTLSRGGPGRGPGCESVSGSTPGLSESLRRVAASSHGRRRLAGAGRRDTQAPRRDSGLQRPDSEAALSHVVVAGGERASAAQAARPLAGGRAAAAAAGRVTDLKSRASRVTVV